MIGEVPFDKIINAITALMLDDVKEIDIFYSDTDHLDRKRVFEITVVAKDQEEGDDETAGKSNQDVRTASPYS